MSKLYFGFQPKLRYLSSQKQDRTKKAPKNQCFYFIIMLLKSQNFDELYTLLKRRECVAHFVFEITLSQGNNAHSFARVRLFPTGTQYPAGSPNPKKSEFYKYYSLKRREFDEIVVFSAGSEKSSVLGVHDFSGFRRKSKISRIIAVLHKVCGQPAPHPASISASKRGLPSRCPRFPLPLQKSRASYRLPLPRFRDFRSRSAQT